MVCLFSITPQGVRVFLKNADKQQIFKKIIPTLSGWVLFASSLEAQGVRLVEAPVRN